MISQNNLVTIVSEIKKVKRCYLPAGDDGDGVGSNTREKEGKCDNCLMAPRQFRLFVLLSPSLTTSTTFCGIGR